MILGQKVFLKCRSYEDPRKILKFPCTVKGIRPKSGEVYVVDGHGAHWVSLYNTPKDPLWVTTR